MNLNNPFCQIDPLSPLCTNPVGVADQAQLLLLQKAWLENRINNPGPNDAGILALLQYTLAQVNQALAPTDCIPAKVQKPTPCLQPGAVFDPNGSLELQTLNYALVNEDGITQGIFVKPCLMYFYTPVIVYSVTFGLHGSQFQIKRLYKSELTWVMVMMRGYLMETTATLQQFAPFITASQIPLYWSGINIPE